MTLKMFLWINAPVTILNDVAFYISLGVNVVADPDTEKG